MKANLVKILTRAEIDNPQVRDQRVYKLDPPLKDYNGDAAYEYVLASASDVLFSGPETYLFPSSQRGEIEDFGNLPGSTRGWLDCDRAIRELGYLLEEAP